MTKPTRFVLSVEAWDRLTLPVIPHADTGESLPILLAVSFRSLDGMLYAVATDRYSIAFQRIKYDGPEIEFLLSAAVCKRIGMLFKAKPKYPATEIEFTIDGTVIAVEGRANLPGIKYEVPKTRLEFDLTDGVYPNVGSLMAGDEPEGDGRIELHSRYLTRLAAAEKYNGPLGIYVGAKRVVVRAGADFIGIVMGIRNASENGENDRTWMPKPFDGWDALAKASKK